MQKWFEFGTGPAGNQFTHEFDGVNQVMGLGIPKTVIATGVNYHFKDPRDIPDSRYEKFKEFKENTSDPIFAYNPKREAIDAVTSATSRSYFESGFGYTYNKGERIDCTYLHVKEWMNSIRDGSIPSCNIDRGFEETVTFYMANLAYLEKRLVEWDTENEKII